MNRTIFETPVISEILRVISHVIMRIAGWKVKGNYSSSLKKCVVVAAPHTSNWDLPIMLMTAFILRLPIRWMGKDTIFRFPFGGLMKWFGGIPVNRTKPENIISISVLKLRYGSRGIFFAIAPEGTRGKVKKWKNGFYRIAVGANVPIALAFMDYPTKTAGIESVFIPRFIEDHKSISLEVMENEVAEIQARYTKYRGKNPK